MYGRHRNGLGIDPATGTGTVIGSDKKEYEIGPRADLYGAKLVGANLAGANLEGAQLAWADLERAWVNLEDLAWRSPGINLTGAIMPHGRIYSGRAPNPGQGTRRGPGGYKY